MTTIPLHFLIFALLLAKGLSMSLSTIKSYRIPGSLTDKSRQLVREGISGLRTGLQKAGDFYHDALERGRRLASRTREVLQGPEAISDPLVIESIGDRIHSAAENFGGMLTGSLDLANSVYGFANSRADQVRRIKNTILHFRNSYEDFLGSIIQEFSREDGYPNLELLHHKSLEIYDLTAQSQNELINLIADRKIRRYKLGSFVFEQLKGIPPLMRKALRAEQKFYESEMGRQFGIDNGRLNLLRQGEDRLFENQFIVPFEEPELSPRDLAFATKPNDRVVNSQQYEEILAAQAQPIG